MIADGQPPAVLLNDNAYQYVYDSLGYKLKEGSRGITLSARSLQIIKKKFAEDAPRFSRDDITDRRNIINALEQGLRQNDGRGVGVVRVQEETTPQRIREVKRHEFVHVMQEKWRLQEQPDAVSMTATLKAALNPELRPAFEAAFDTASKTLQKIGYKPENAWVEIPAWVAGGHYDLLGLSDSQAEALLTPYASQLDRVYGGRAVQEMLDHGSPVARKVAAEFPITPERDFSPAPHRNGSDRYSRSGPPYETPPDQVQGEAPPSGDVPMYQNENSPMQAPAAPFSLVVPPPPGSGNNRLPGLLQALPPAAGFLTNRPATAGFMSSASGAALPGMHTLPPRLKLQDVLGSPVLQASNTQADTAAHTGRLTLAQVQAHEAAQPLIVQHINRLPLAQAMGMYAASGRLEQLLLGGTLRQRLQAAAQERSLTPQELRRAQALGLTGQ